MTDFFSKVAAAKDLTHNDQKKAGMPVSGTIETEHRDFLKSLTKMIESGDINPDEPKSLLNTDVYDGLDETWKDKTDLILMNVAQQLLLITQFMDSAETPAESPQLQTMVEQLWQSKQQIEEHYDVFKF
jgi:hypothetical protein